MVLNKLLLLGDTRSSLVHSLTYLFANEIFSYLYCSCLLSGHKTTIDDLEQVLNAHYKIIILIEYTSLTPPPSPPIVVCDVGFKQHSTLCRQPFLLVHCCQDFLETHNITLPHESYIHLPQICSHMAHTNTCDTVFLMLHEV